MNVNKTWTKQEDKALEKLVQIFGQKRWKILANTVNKINPEKKRNEKVCKERWNKLKAMNENKNCWDLTEEFLFFEAHSIMGNKWCSIKKFLPGKSDNNLKNHFYSSLRKILRKIPKSRFNFEDFKDKIKAFYILSFILRNIHPDSGDLEIKIDYANESSFNENAYIFKLLKRQSIEKKQLQIYLEKLSESIVKDKYIKERNRHPLEDFSPDSTEKLIRSVVYYDIILKCLEFSNNAKEGLSHNKNLRISQFIKTYMNKIVFDISINNKTPINEAFIKNFKLFFCFNNKEESLHSTEISKILTTAPCSFNFHCPDVGDRKSIFNFNNVIMLSPNSLNQFIQQRLIQQMLYDNNFNNNNNNIGVK